MCLLSKANLSGALGICMLLCLRAGVAGAEPLRPSKPWDLDYGDTRCSATREYGDAATPLTLAIIPAPNGETYELLLVYKKSHTSFAEERQGSVDFGSGPIKAWLLHYGTKDGKLTFDRFRIDAKEMEKARAATSVTFHVADSPDVSFQLDHVSPLLDGLRSCTADLKNYWNFDGEKNGHIAVPAKGDVRAVFRWQDYPEVAIDTNEEGTAQYLLLIDEKGSVAGCHVVRPSGVPSLDAMGCVVILGRAKFKPALDAAGKPTKSTVTTPPVTWQLG